MIKASIQLDFWLALTSLFRRSNLKFNFMWEIFYTKGYMSFPKIKQVLLIHFSFIKTTTTTKMIEHLFLPDTIVGTRDAAMSKPKLPQETKRSIVWLAGQSSNTICRTWQNIKRKTLGKYTEREKGREKRTSIDWFIHSRKENQVWL